MCGSYHLPPAARAYPPLSTRPDSFTLVSLTVFFWRFSIRISVRLFCNSIALLYTHTRTRPVLKLYFKENVGFVSCLYHILCFVGYFLTLTCKVRYFHGKLQIINEYYDDNNLIEKEKRRWEVDEKCGERQNDGKGWDKAWRFIITHFPLIAVSRIRFLL